MISLALVNSKLSNWVSFAHYFDIRSPVPTTYNLFCLIQLYKAFFDYTSAEVVMLYGLLLAFLCIL